MTLTKIDAPPLGTVAQGGAGLWAIEAQGFSPDGKTLLVKAIYSDDAYPALPTRTGFWLYDLSSKQYTACVNQIIANGRDIEVTDVSIGMLGGKTQLVATYHDTGAAANLDFNKLALIRDGSLIYSDLVLQITGNQADAAISAVRTTANGRFIAIETAANNLSAALDTNSSKDIYLLDLTLNTSRLISTVNGAEVSGDSLLGDVMIGRDGTLSVAFESAQVFTTQDTNTSEDVFIWHLAAAQISTTAAGTIDLVSRTSAGAVGGVNPLLTLNGVLFDSESGALSSTDLNSANDIWQSNSTSVTAVALSATGTLEQATTLGSSSDGGRYVVAVTASPEIAGAGGAGQLVLVDTVAQTHVTISLSASGAVADDAVISPVLSADGSHIAFSSQASNLGGGQTDGQMHLFIGDTGVVADLTESVKNADILAYSWKAHTLLSGVSMLAGTNPSAQITDNTGSASFSGITETSLSLTATRAIPTAEASATSSAVNLQDAIAILKMIVGLNVNGTGKSLSPYQTYAADYDADGTVGLTDAIGVLKHVVGLTAPNPQWVFFNEADATIPGKTIIKPNEVPGTVPALTADLSEATAQVHTGLVGVLRGDVDGSFAGATGAQDLDVTQPAYFTSLSVAQGLNLNQFGIY